MRLHPLTIAVVAAVVVSTANLAVATRLSADDDTITIRGCVRRSDLSIPIAPSMLAWGRHDIMITGAAAMDSPGSVIIGGAIVPSFYWLENDEHLAEYVGLDVVISGDLGDLARGEIEIDEDDGITKIEMNLRGEKETARIPTRWLYGTGLDIERDFEIVGWRLDVDNVRVIGVCRQ